MEWQEQYGRMRPRVLKVVDVEPSESDYINGYSTSIYTVKLTKEQQKNPAKTISYWFTDHESCGHSYDCCGCWRYTAVTWNGNLHTKRNEYRFILRGSKNI